MNEVNWMQQGWECPKCGAVMAPHVDCCVNCRGYQTGGVVTTDQTVDNRLNSTGVGIAKLPYILTKETECPEDWEKVYFADNLIGSCKANENV